MIRVKILESNSVIELNVEEITAEDLLRKLGLPISEHIVIRNGVVITEEDVIKSGDEVVIYTVKSGG